MLGIIFMVSHTPHFITAELLDFKLTRLSLAVLVGGVEYVLSEVCVVDASGALPGAFTAGLLRKRGWSGHARDLRLHGRSVSTIKSSV